MGFTIRNSVDALYPAQARVDTVDLAVLAAGNNLTGVHLDLYTGVLGCNPTLGGGLSVAVAAGVVRIGGRRVIVAGGSVATTADPTNPRIVLISVNTSGAKIATLGTPEAETGTVGPKPPAVPVDHVAIATVYLPAAAATIADVEQITDKRVILWAEPIGEHVAWYGVRGNDNVVNEDVNLQAAIDAAFARNRCRLYFHAGTYNYGSLIWQHGVIPTGAGKLANGNLLTALRYNGADGGIGITDTGTGSINFTYAEDISFIGNARDGVSYAHTLIKFNRKLDSHSGFINCQFQHFRMYGVDLAGGCINTVLEKVRIDSGEIGGSGVHLKAAGNDSITFNVLEGDNGSSLALKGCNYVHIDCSTMTDGVVNVVIVHPYFEINNSMAALTGAIQITPKQGLAGRGFVNLTVLHWREAPIVSAVFDGIRCEPAHDFVHLVLVNCSDFTIAGIPSARQMRTDYTLRRHHNFTAINPITFSSGISSTRSNCEEHVGDSNFGNLYQYGAQLCLTMVGDPTAWTGNPHTAQIGTQYVTGVGTTSQTVRQVSVVGSVVPTGYFTGITATGNAGEAFVTITGDVSKFLYNMYFIVAGETVKRVSHTVGQVVHFVSGVLATSPASATITAGAPTFRTKVDTWT